MNTKVSLALFIAFLVCVSSTEIDEADNFSEDLNNLEQLESLEVPDASGKHSCHRGIHLFSHASFICLFKLEICEYMCEHHSKLSAKHCDCVKKSGGVQTKSIKKENYFKFKKMDTNCLLNRNCAVGKRQYSFDCQLLCYIGQGGKMCKCNYAPFVGK